MKVLSIIIVTSMFLMILTAFDNHFNVLNSVLLYMLSIIDSVNSVAADFMDLPHLILC
jgi:hypothetical protein